MKTFHVKSGSYSLIGSGTLISFEANDIIFSFQLPIPDKHIFDIDVAFKFSKDENRGPGFELVNPLADRAAEDIDRLAEYDVIIYNSDDPNGISNEKPIFLGEYSGLHLYLNFTVFVPPSSSEKVLHYAFYTSYKS